MQIIVSGEERGEFVMFKNDFKKFYGTFPQLIHFLDKINYWKDEDERQQYINNYRFDKKIYKEFSVSASNKRIIEEGAAFPEKKVPTYPDHTTITIKTEGYSEDEINDAIKCLSLKLKDTHVKSEGIRASIIKAE